jgi:hypothetical protein
MKTKLILILSLLTLISCEDTYEYWNISKFDIDDNVLSEGEKIKLLYFSNSPNENLENNYYLHLIAISLESNDTINILTTSKNFITENSGNEIYNFYKENSLASKVIANARYGKPIDHIDDLKNFKEKRPDKVIRNTKFDDIADNKYKSIIGHIGKASKNESN